MRASNDLHILTAHRDKYKAASKQLSYLDSAITTMESCVSELFEQKTELVGKTLMKDIASYCNIVIANFKSSEAFNINQTTKALYWLSQTASIETDKNNTAWQLIKGYCTLFVIAGVLTCTLAALHHLDLVYFFVGLLITFIGAASFSYFDTKFHNLSENITFFVSAIETFRARPELRQSREFSEVSSEEESSDMGSRNSLP